MKSLLCLLGHHEYTMPSAEIKVIDERHGYLICRVAMCCNKCGKLFEDIIAVPFPEWLRSRYERRGRIMKFEIEISDEEVKEQASKLLAEKLVREIDGGHGFGWTYRKDVKEIIREVLRERMDDLSDRAVQAASKSIENRAVKKLIDKLRDEQ